MLGCLLDCLPVGVNKERISSATMKEAYVQKMVKVFTEHDRWSLISLSNNSGKNLELKFVSSLRRQFEFSVDSFQIILDRLLESYMQQDSQRKNKSVDLQEHQADNQNKLSAASLKQAEKEKSSQTAQTDGVHEKESQTELSLQNDPSDPTKDSAQEENNRENTPIELKGISEHTVKEVSEQSSSKKLSEQSETKETSTKVSHEPELLDEIECPKVAEHSVQTPPCDDREPVCSNQEQTVQSEPCKHSKQEDLTEQMGQFELPGISETDLAEELHSNGHSDERDSGKCLNEELKSSEKDEKTTPRSTNISSNAKTEPHTQLTDERNVESETGEQIRTEREDDGEKNEMTEESLASKTTHKDTLSSDCSCSTSSTSLQTHDTQPTDTLEIPCTLLTESSEENLSDTQDNLPAPPSLVSDKKTSCLPSSKASERLSHMVVLKHSSPKPPRRMCRKVSPTAHQTESIPTPCSDRSPCPSPEPEEALAAKSPPILDSTKTHDPDTSSNIDSSFDLTSSPNEPELTQESPDSSADDSCEKEEGCEDTPAAHIDPQSEPTPPETASAAIQSEPPDSADLLYPDKSDTHESLENTSEVELSDEDDKRKLQDKRVDVDQDKDIPLSPHSVTPPGSCLAPPALSLAAPCFMPSSPSLSPPQCLTPPPHCMSTVSPSTSFSSAPLSFSPTSSCLSSPPYLTPPMLSLSPPPLCLSPPLLCLTPPVDSVDIEAQVSADMEPLILNTDSEEHMKEPSTQQGVLLLQTEDKKEDDYISPMPQGSKPVSFPITIPNSTSNVLSQSRSEDPGESALAKADVASSAPQESKEASQVIMPETSNTSQALDFVPDVEVLAESMYGDFEAAMDHLRYRLIATRNPEEIRGGGLLKYSNLLVRDYRPASETQIKTLERYMCSRFFIDFPDVQEQQRKILSYLKNHFIGEERSKYQYLMTLRRVVDDSTVCLMGHERRQTLNMITVLALKVLGEQNIIPNTDHVTCFYQPAQYIAEHSAPYITEPSYCSYYIPQGGSTLLYQPYPLHLHTQTGLV